MVMQVDWIRDGAHALSDVVDTERLSVQLESEYRDKDLEAPASFRLRLLQALSNAVAR